MPSAGLPQSRLKCDRSSWGRESCRSAAQCAALAHLYLRDTGIGARGTERIEGVLSQCEALTHVDLRDNKDFW